MQLSCKGFCWFKDGKPICGKSTRCCNGKQLYLNMFVSCLEDLMPQKTGSKFVECIVVRKSQWNYWPRSEQAGVRQASYRGLRIWPNCWRPVLPLLVPPPPCLSPTLICFFSALPKTPTPKSQSDLGGRNYRFGCLSVTYIEIKETKVSSFNRDYGCNPNQLSSTDLAVPVGHCVTWVTSRLKTFLEW